MFAYILVEARGANSNFKILVCSSLGWLSRTASLNIQFEHLRSNGQGQVLDLSPVFNLVAFGPYRGLRENKLFRSNLSIIYYSDAKSISVSCHTKIIVYKDILH